MERKIGKANLNGEGIHLGVSFFFFLNSISLLFELRSYLPALRPTLSLLLAKARSLASNGPF